MRASVNIVLYKTRLKKNNKYPVKLRIVYQREHRDFKIGIDLSEEAFVESMSSKPKKQYREIADELTAIKSKANRIIKELPHFTFDKFETLFYNHHKDASDIFPFFDEYINNLEKEDRIKTAVAYRTAMNAFRKYHSGRLNLYDITPQFLQKYHKDQLGAGKSPTTIGIYMRTLRTIYNYCTSKGVIKKDETYPFGRGKYIIPAGRNIKKALSLEEIGKIARYVTIPGTFIDRAKDFWMLSYYLGGINFKDILLLRNKNIDGDMLRYVREKTKKTTQGNQIAVSTYIIDEARSIIDKWKTRDEQKDAFLFPFINKTDDSKEQYAKIDQFIQNANKNLKHICKELGIEKNVTTYYSRHSAATVLKRSGASISQIQELLGHSSSTITQKYLDSFEDETKKELSKALLKY
jgi:integrase